MNTDGLLEPLNLEITKPTAVHYQQDIVDDEEGEDDEPKSILELEPGGQHNPCEVEVYPISVTIPAYAYHHQWVKMNYDSQPSYNSNYSYPVQASQEYPSYSYPAQSTQSYYAPTISRSGETTIETVMDNQSRSNENYSDNSNSSAVQGVTEELWKKTALDLERGKFF